MKRVFIAVISVVFCCLLISIILKSHQAKNIANARDFPEGRVAMDLSLNKDDFVIGEPIVLNIKLKNNGTEAADGLLFTVDGKCDIHMTDMNDKNIFMEHFESDMAFCRTGWKRSLNAGEIITTSLDITRGEIFNQEPACPTIARRFGIKNGKLPGYVIGPGKYILHVVHIYDVGHQEMASRRTISFSVRAPNEEESNALALFETVPQYESSIMDDAEEQSILAASNAYDKVWNSYNNTVYAPYALYYAARLNQHTGNIEGAAQRYNTLLQKHPEFALKVDAAYYQALCMQKLGKIKEFNDSMDNLMKNHSNHLVSTLSAHGRKSPIIELDNKLNTK